MAQLHCNFFSYSVGYPIDLQIILPSMTAPDMDHPETRTHKIPAKYPLLYLLHGHGNDYQGWLRYTSMERYAEERKIAVVTMSVGNKGYMNAAYGEEYYKLIEEELPEFLQANFPVSERQEDTYIAGLSMGGYGALAHGLGHPQSYRAMGAFSPGVYIGMNDQLVLGHSMPEMMDLKKLVKKCKAEGKKIPELFMCVGQDDFLYRDITDFHQFLVGEGIAHRYDDLPGYRHEWALWDRELEQFLDWIPRTDAWKDVRAQV